MSDTVELLIPLDAIAWLFRHAPEAFTGARVFHAQTEMVGPVTEHHLASVTAARRPAIRAAVEKGKGPFLDEQPIHSHLVRNPSGLFLLCPLPLCGSQVDLQDGLLLAVLRALGVDVYAGTAVSLEGLSSVGIGRLVRMTRGATAWIQSALARPSAQAVIDLRAQNPSTEAHTLAARVLALRPPTDDEINQAHDDIRQERERKIQEKRRAILEEYQRAQKEVDKALAESAEVQHRLAQVQARADKVQMDLEAFDVAHNLKEPR